MAAAHMRASRLFGLPAPRRLIDKMKSPKSAADPVMKVIFPGTTRSTAGLCPRTSRTYSHSLQNVVIKVRVRRPSRTAGSSGARYKLCTLPWSVVACASKKTAQRLHDASRARHRRVRCGSYWSARSKRVRPLPHRRPALGGAERAVHESKDRRGRHQVDHRPRASRPPSTR